VTAEAEAKYTAPVATGGEYEDRPDDGDTESEGRVEWKSN